MKKISSVILAFSLCSTPVFAAPTVQKMNLDVPKQYFVPYTGAAAGSFPDGLPLGIGSGMCLLNESEDGTLTFLAVTDRGPNANSPKLLVDGMENPQATKMFPVPDFTPKIGWIKVRDGKATLMKTMDIKDSSGKVISGRPLEKSKVGSTGETALSDSLHILGFDNEGLDTEGIGIDRENGTWWLCDEYGPFFVNIDPNTGKILKKYTPGESLPEIIAKRQPNRGLEGLAVGSNNKIYGAIQSILDVGHVKIKESKAQFTRIVELDPKTGKTRMLAYPHDVDAYKHSRDAKVGEIAPVADSRFLLIEQGKGKDKKMRNLIYMIDIENATDISSMTAQDGRPLETVDSWKELKALGVKPVSKKLIVDIKALGWQPKKAEGMALLNDGKTIAVISDNDFGFAGVVENAAKDKKGKVVKKPAKYTTDGTGKMQLDKVETHSKIIMKPTEEKSAFWLITLDNPIR